MITKIKRRVLLNETRAYVFREPHQAIILITALEKFWMINISTDKIDIKININSGDDIFKIKAMFDNICMELGIEAELIY